MTGPAREQLRVPAPAVTVLPTCRGGAVVVGSRRPVVLVGRDLLERLDEDEVEGVLAHELAHVRRRDNLVATLLGAVRDLTFFVPFGGWAIRQLHRERELAADQVAVAATGRPGALASGLLKVLEVATPTRPPLRGLGAAWRARPPGPGARRGHPPLSPVRKGLRGRRRHLGVATAVVVALVLPGVLAGADRQRDAVAVLWSTSAPTAVADRDPVVAGEARAFDVYRRSSLDVGPAA
jgi:beta-lactamase regulating signal transducer with metallopeptidase domain